MTDIKRRIVCYGDSNTYGYEPRFGGRYPKEVRWTDRLEKAGFEVFNEGENGRSIPGSDWMRERALRHICGHEPFDLLCIMLGSNDLLMEQGFCAEDVAAKMEGFLDVVLEAVPANRVLLISPPVMHPGDWVYERRLLTESVRMSSCYRELAERLGSYFADAETWGVGITYDGVHFSETGHAAFAKGIGDRLTEIFEEHTEEN